MNGGIASAPKFPVGLGVTAALPAKHVVNARVNISIDRASSLLQEDRYLFRECRRDGGGNPLASDDDDDADLLEEEEDVEDERFRFLFVFGAVLIFLFFFPFFCLLYTITVTIRPLIRYNHMLTLFRCKI